MPVEVSEDRVIIRFDTKEPLELGDLTEGLVALERQYHKALDVKGVDKRGVKAKLYVTKLKTGSIETELAFWIFVGGVVFQAMDYTNIAIEFSERVRRGVDFLSGKSRGKAPTLDKDDLDDLERILKPVAGKKGAGLSVKRLKLHKKSGDKEFLAEYDFGEHDLSNALMNIDKEREQLEDKTKSKHHIEKDVLLVFHQTNKGEAKSKGRSYDLAVIEKVSNKPLPVYFPTESSLIKHKMTRITTNPLFTGFMVDVDVQYAGDEPAVYTIMEVHGDPIDIGPPGEP